ncbi:hypothetical protein PIB30_094039, partial [Stylosanthes scabra]|nr:hypothetical protein [Stylosanthes scabra]
RLNMNSARDAILQGLEDFGQFLLEEMNARENDITIVCSRKDIVNCINGKEATNWESGCIQIKATMGRACGVKISPSKFDCLTEFSMHKGASMRSGFYDQERIIDGTGLFVHETYGAYKTPAELWDGE